MSADDVGQHDDLVLAGRRLPEGVDLVLAVRVADILDPSGSGKTRLKARDDWHFCSSVFFAI